MVYFVGAGSGAADLITVRGAELIKRADVVIYAGSLVDPALIDNYACAGVKKYDSAYLTLEEVIDIIKAEDGEGRVIVRLHTGEPSLYGAVREQMDLLDERHIPYDSCPGVSSFCGAAAALNLEYTLPEVSQSLIITRMEGKTPVPERESIESMASHRSSMAIYLSSGMLKELSEALIRGGYDKTTPAAIVYRASWENEKKIVCTVGELAEEGEKHGISRQSVILVGDAVAHSAYERSKLYDPGFETLYRKKSQ